VRLRRAKPEFELEIPDVCAARSDTHLVDEGPVPLAAFESLVDDRRDRPQGVCRTVSGDGDALAADAPLAEVGEGRFTLHVHRHPTRPVRTTSS
jgi:hypothetical protein